MKKLIALLLAVIMILSLAACGSGSKTEESAETEAAETEPAEAEDKTEAEPAAENAAVPGEDVSIICATNAGGAMDTAVRLLAPHLEDITSTNFPVTNIAGSAGWVALAQLMAGSDEDYQVCYVAFPQIIVASMDPDADMGMTIDDFKPIALDVDDSNILVAVGGEERFSDLESFLAYAKDNDVLIGTSAGVYSDDNVCKTYILQQLPDLKFQTVHFTSTSEGMAALLGGNIDILICNVSEAVSNIDAGELTGVGICSGERFASLPDVQTFSELGYNVICGSTRGYVAKNTISDEMYEELCNVFDQAMDDESYISDATERQFGLNKQIGADFSTWLDAQKADMESMYEMLQ